MKKIVIRVQMNCDKCRKQAMKIAISARGVSSVSLEGDTVVVKGEAVDPVCLMNLMRKKFSDATLEDVVTEEVEANDDGTGGGDAADEQDDANEQEEESKPVEYIHGHYPPPCATYYYHVVYDPYPNSCSIQ